MILLYYCTFIQSFCLQSVPFFFSSLSNSYTAILHKATETVRCICSLILGPREKIHHHNFSKLNSRIILSELKYTPGLFGQNFGRFSFFDCFLCSYGGECQLPRIFVRKEKYCSQPKLSHFQILKIHKITLHMQTLIAITENLL